MKVKKERKREKETRMQCKIKQKEREEKTKRGKDVMQKIEVEHIENNVISIFQASFFRCLHVDVPKGVDNNSKVKISK